MDFFTSDLHLGHANIIKYCNRPWGTVEAMNDGLISNWNTVVSSTDRVFVVGDFSLTRHVDRIEAWLSSLNGEKHLVMGNHDNAKATEKVRGWASVSLMRDEHIDGYDVRLSHFRLDDWRGPRILLHGHSHNKFGRETGKFSVDVGVDANNWFPVRLTDVCKYLSRKGVQ